MKYLILFFCFFLLLMGCSNSQEKRTSIAIITPISHPSLEQIEKGFRKTMGNYQMVTYNAHGNKTLLRSEIEEIAKKKFDLIFTIGTTASQMTKEVFLKKGIKMPVVFTCVNDPVGFGIIKEEAHPEGFVTGVKEMLDFEKEIFYLLQGKPSLKSCLLVYNPLEPGLVKDQQEVKSLLEKKGIDLLLVEVFQTNEIKLKASPFMDQVDAVLVLKDNTVVSGLDALVKLCNQHHIPLVASDLDSPDKGASFGYGVYEIEFGIEAAKKALAILEKKLLPSEIPVTPVSNFSLRVNAEASKKQGFHLHLAGETK